MGKNNKKEYYAGEGCTCSAHGAEECGCSADWTDPEIYKLRDRVKELEYEEELSNKAWDIQRERIEELEAGIEAIAPWLSASLTEHEHDGKGEYLKACNEIFRLD